MTDGGQKIDIRNFTLRTHFMVQSNDIFGQLTLKTKFTRLKKIKCFLNVKLRTTIFYPLSVIVAVSKIKFTKKIIVICFIFFNGKSKNFGISTLHCYFLPMGSLISISLTNDQSSIYGFPKELQHHKRFPTKIYQFNDTNFKLPLNPF